MWSTARIITSRSVACRSPRNRQRRHRAGAPSNTFVKIAQVGPALVRLAADEPGIEIVRQPSAVFELVDDLVDLRLNVRVGVVALQRIARASILYARNRCRRNAASTDRSVGSDGPAGRQACRSRGLREIPSSSSRMCWVGMVTSRTVSVQLFQKPPSNVTRPGRPEQSARWRSAAGIFLQ